MRTINPYDPVGQMTATSSGTSSKVRITKAGHGLVSGNKVLIKDTQGTTEANGYFTITRIDDDNFDLDGTTYANAMSYGGNIYKIQIVKAKLVSGTATNVFVTAQVRFFASGLVQDTRSYTKKITSSVTDVELFRSHETQAILLDKVIISNEDGSTREVRISIEHFELTEKYKNVSVLTNEIAAGETASAIVSADGRTIVGAVDIP